jgi:hypothetical protein
MSAVIAKLIDDRQREQEAEIPNMSQHARPRERPIVACGWPELNNAGPL